jgi:hypothetical protein
MALPLHLLETAGGIGDEDQRTDERATPPGCGAQGRQQLKKSCGGQRKLLIRLVSPKESDDLDLDSLPQDLDFLPWAEGPRTPPRRLGNEIDIFSEN